MSHAFRCVLLPWCLAIAGFLPQPAEALVMTFDALAPDFSELTTYTEDGLTLAAVNGAPDHFHPNDRFDKENGPVRRVVGRAKDAINAERGLFEFLGGELTVTRLLSGAVEQDEEQLRRALKQAVEERVGFHRESGEDQAASFE